ncbi:MAG: ChaN family lipoprotein [Pseudomonadota bacterium]
MSNVSPPTVREQLLRLQRDTFSRLEEALRSRQMRETRQLRNYRRPYDREVRSYRRVSCKSELLEKVLDASIVYCGDYHTLRQAQRTPIRILREVLPERDVHLALEMVPQSCEKLANDYIRKRIDESRFLDGMNYRERWGFPWAHYRQLFVFAREHGIRIVALNSDQGDRLELTARDELAAELIVRHALALPDVLIFALYGDLHVARAHIPARVEKLLRKHGIRRKTLTVFQNSEPIYWDLAEKEMEERVDVVEITAHSYCILSAAPWIKWQSYQSWLEDQSDLLDDSSAEDAEPAPDYYHQILDLADRIGRFLELVPAELEQFSVLTAKDVRIIDEINTYCEECEHHHPTLAALIRSEVVENGSSLFPEHSVLYLGDVSENRAAEKAAQLLVSKLTPRFSVYGHGTDRKEIFYRLVLWEAIAYFGSKIVNPKRKCDRYLDFERLLKQHHGRRLRGELRAQREIAVMVLAHRSYENRRVETGRKQGLPRRLYRLPPQEFFRCASALGKILADRMYHMMITDEMSKGTIRDLFRPVGEGEREGFDRYWQLAGIVARVHSAHVSKEDRF